ncbi:MAG: enoyl-CoA hydratase/isomerase family protein [Planctomycetes bacterium]|nr:enoyl-CoA hydratase/isomerase family protein [Planctomycetota bacterium]
MSTEFKTLTFERGRDGVAVVTLSRPEVRNAFDADLITELHQVFAGPAVDDLTRAVILRGQGPAFCAGADLAWMRASAKLSLEENRKGAERMARMFRSVAECLVPVVAVVHGAALGGGAGLVAAADVAIGVPTAKIGFTEVRLGIVPAVIAPFVLRKIGRTHASRYFVTGEIFDGIEADRIGLLQRVVEPEHLEAEVDRFVSHVLAAGPHATRESKRLIELVDGVPVRDCTAVTAPLIARLRASEEGQEGMSAFLEKRKPTWVGPRTDS